VPQGSNLPALSLLTISGVDRKRLAPDRVAADLTERIQATCWPTMPRSGWTSCRW
jgi:hypothetical protein